MSDINRLISLATIWHRSQAWLAGAVGIAFVATSNFRVTDLESLRNADEVFGAFADDEDRRMAVRYVASDCLTVRDNRDRSHLLCHVFARDGLTRGLAVSQGDLLGTVAPAGYANNNGLSHIHYAVHTSFSGSSLATVPFTGEYALEGQNLFDDGSYNQYSGLTLVSSNGASGPTLGTRALGAFIVSCPPMRSSA